MRGSNAVLSGVADVANRRRTIFSGELSLVEDSSLSARSAIKHGHSPRFQIALPYFGAFTWRVGHATTLVDTNQVLFVSAGEDFSETHPIHGIGHASIIVTIEDELLDMLCGGIPPRECAQFRGRSRPSNARLRMLAHQLRQQGEFLDNALIGEELTAQVLREVVEDCSERLLHPSRLVERAKHLLHARYCESVSLRDIADELGVAAVYLTQSFTRFEGMPLYHYLLQLRLNRALYELPRRESITELALDLGFSSHSHFTSAFKSTFGLAPSEFRARNRPSRVAVSVARNECAASSVIDLDRTTASATPTPT